MIFLNPHLLRIALKIKEYHMTNVVTLMNMPLKAQY